MEEGEQEVAELPHFEFEAEESSSSGNDHNERKQKRKICRNGCNRPSTVCLCAHLPSQPLSTSTEILILQHPHELRHRLATVPLLSNCLSNCQTVTGRRLRLGSSSLLDSLHNASVQSPLSPHRALYLFPATDSQPSIELSQWVASNRERVEIGDLVLIVFDGTWSHAREMVRASVPFLEKFATRVCLRCDVGVEGGSVFDSELVLRKEPFGGCVSTMEAVARALRVLEVNGVEIEERLIGVLRAMVRFQACYLKPMKPRPKMVKKP